MARTPTSLGSVEWVGVSAAGRLQPLSKVGPVLGFRRPHAITDGDVIGEVGRLVDAAFCRRAAAWMHWLVACAVSVEWYARAALIMMRTTSVGQMNRRSLRCLVPMRRLQYWSSGSRCKTWGNREPGSVAGRLPRLARFSPAAPRARDLAPRLVYESRSGGWIILTFETPPWLMQSWARS